jgi:hypothetical protein
LPWERPSSSLVAEVVLTRLQYVMNMYPSRERYFLIAGSAFLAAGMYRIHAELVRQSGFYRALDEVSQWLAATSVDVFSISVLRRSLLLQDMIEGGGHGHILKRSALFAGKPHANVDISLVVERTPLLETMMMSRPLPVFAVRIEMERIGPAANDVAERIFERD